MSERSYPALFLFAGIGGGALGFQAAREELRGLNARFHVAGAVDFDPLAAASFELLTGHPCAVGDLGTMEPADLRAVCSEPPRVLFTSPPCKGWSGLMSEELAATPKYQDMNDLAFRGVWLALEAWPESPPALILLENVPRIQTRGRSLLDRLQAMLRGYGYATRETVHCCGRLGGLAERRRRTLLVARHTKQVPAFWLNPPHKPLKAIGDVLSTLPVPSSGEGGPMHRVPAVEPITGQRLASIPAGQDWRALRGDLKLGCSPRSGAYGVASWSRPSGTVTAWACHDNGPFTVADPRPQSYPNIPMAPDGTTHRPMTALELAALQGFPVQHRGAWLELAGSRDTDYRQAVGNAVPPPAAEAIAQTALRCLLAAELGTWELSSSGVWVDERRAL